MENWWAWFMILNGCLLEFDFAYSHQKRSRYIPIGSKIEQFWIDQRHNSELDKNDYFRYFSGCALLSVINQHIFAISNGNECDFDVLLNSTIRRNNPFCFREHWFNYPWYSISLQCPFTQIHFCGELFRFFSPNLNDITIIHEDWCILMVFGLSLITFVHFQSTVPLQIVTLVFVSWEE